MASHDQLESICNILLLLLLLLYTRVLCPMGGHFKITLIIAPKDFYQKKLLYLIAPAAGLLFLL